MTGEVSPAGPDGEPVAAGELRASHEDRDVIVEQLRTAAGDGRLTADELDTRLELALTARTYGELAALTADLPVSGAGGLAVPGSAVVTPKDLTRIQIGSGHTTRDGRWAVPQRIEVAVTSGSVKARMSWGPNVPEILRIEIAGRVRSGSITARPPRRTLWQWLRREPRRYQSALA